MTAINKIYPQMLAPVLERENLICSIWIFQPSLSAVCSIGQFSLEVREDLATTQQFSKTKAYHQPNWGAPERMAIHSSY